MTTCKWYSSDFHEGYAKTLANILYLFMSKTYLCTFQDIRIISSVGSKRSGLQKKHQWDNFYFKSNITSVDDTCEIWIKINNLT